MFDTAPLTEAMQAKRAFLWATMAPEQQAQLQGFNPEEVALLDFGTLPYVLVPKQPAPDTQQQAALPPAVVGNLLTGVKKIVFDDGRPTTCTIDNGRVTCTMPPADIGPAVRIVSRSLAGVVAGNILELEWRDVFEFSLRQRLRQSNPVSGTPAGRSRSRWARSRQGIRHNDRVRVGKSGNLRQVDDEDRQRHERRHMAGTAMNRLVVPIAVAIFSATAFVVSAQAQELRAAPDPGALAQESRDIAGRWLGATDAAIQSAGKAGGTLTNIVTGKFDGLSKTIAIADAASTLGAASAGDVRGTVSGAAAIAVGGKVTAGGAALFGEIGTVAGGAIGSFFPVIGNIAGSIVGGAVGTAAGGFICAFGYDKYVKDYVAKGVTGIVSVFDTAPLTEAMEAKRAFLWATMAPEERAQLQGFNPEEVTLLDFGTLPYVLVPKQPLSQAPAAPPQQEAALGDSVPGSFLITWDTMPDHSFPCTITGTKVSCTDEMSRGGGHLTSSSTGTVSGNTLDATLDVQTRSIWRTTGVCPSTTEFVGHEKMTLEKGGRVVTSGSVVGTVVSQSGPCTGGPKTWTASHNNVTGKWRPN